MATTDHRREAAGQRQKTQARFAARAMPDYLTLRTPQVARLVEAISNPDFVAVVLFSAIGLLATLNLILRLPDIGVM